MSLVSVFQCDGPTCVMTLEDAFDEDDLLTAGWLLVSFQGDEEEREAHLCSHGCLVSWAAEVAAEEVT